MKLLFSGYWIAKNTSQRMLVITFLFCSMCGRGERRKNVSLHRLCLLKCLLTILHPSKGRFQRRWIQGQLQYVVCFDVKIIMKNMRRFKQYLKNHKDQSYNGETSNKYDANNHMEFKKVLSEI